MKSARHILVYGRVQGVNFRREARAQAEQLGLTGWVHNHADGHVEIVAEGEAEAIDEFVAWCENGSPKAEVSHVTATATELHNYPTFSVR